MILEQEKHTLPKNAPAPEAKKQQAKTAASKEEDQLFNMPITPVDYSKPRESTEMTPEQKMSRGEKVYKWVVYSGLNFWVNLIGSLATADYLIRGAGKNHLGRAVGLGAQGLNKLGMPMKNAYHNSKTVLETLSLMSGGWLLLWPMKYLEDHKREAVHKLNDMLGVDQTAPDGHKMTPDEIYVKEEQPPQSWFNVIKRRVMATLTVVAVGQVIEHTMGNKNVKLPSHEHLLNPYDPTSAKVVLEGSTLGGKERATNIIMDGIKWAAKKVGAERTFQIPWVQSWLGLAALDTGFTKITAIVMKMTSGAGEAHAPHEIENAKAKPLPKLDIGDTEAPAEKQERSIAPASKSSVATIIDRKNSDGFAAAQTARRAEGAEYQVAP